MSFWHRLLYLFGLRPDPEPHTYNLNSDLHLIIADLAQREQRSTEEIAEQLLGQALRERQVAAELWQRWQSLTTREQQVAALTCMGYSSIAIANQLGVSTDTVKTHTRNILGKFGISSRKELSLLLSTWDFSDWLPPTSRD